MPLVKIPTASLVTYYHQHSTSQTPLRDEARNFVLHLKEYTRRVPPPIDVPFGSESYRVSDVASAHALLTRIARARLAWVYTALGLSGAPASLQLVPIPSSETAALVGSHRWPARTICRTLESLGFGVCIPVVRFAKPGASVSSGGPDRPDAAVRFNEIVCDDPAAHLAAAPVVLVDDVVNRGAAAAACAERIWQRHQLRVAGLFTIGYTDSRVVGSAMDPRAATIEYDTNVVPTWGLRIRE